MDQEGGESAFQIARFAGILDNEPNIGSADRSFGSVKPFGSCQ